MQHPTEEEEPRGLAPEEHDVTRVLDAPKTRPDTIAAPSQGVSVRKALKNAVKVGHVALGPFLTPALYAR